MLDWFRDDLGGVKDGLDDGVRAELLMDTLTTVKEDLSDLCAVERARA